MKKNLILIFTLIFNLIISIFLKDFVWLARFDILISNNEDILQSIFSIFRIKLAVSLLKIIWFYIFEGSFNILHLR